MVFLTVVCHVVQAKKEPLILCTILRTNVVKECMRVDNLIISEKTPGFNRISPKGMTTNVWKKLRIIFFF